MKNFSIQKSNLSLNFVYTVLFFLLLPLYPMIYGQSIPWVKQGVVLDKGTTGSWDDIAVGHPSVVFKSDTFHMWYYGYSGTVKGIGHATSLDGISWIKDTLHNPILIPGQPGEWDHLGIGAPNVILVNDTFHMWYSGVVGVDISYIGQATSSDGLVWTKDSDNPVLLSGPESWESWWVCYSPVIFENDTFHMWYGGGTNDWPSYIGYATATNPYGKNWTKDTLHNPVLSPSPVCWDYPRVECPNVTTYHDTFYLFYSGGQYWHQDIGFATSTDKVTWTKNPEPCLIRGNVGEWDASDVCYPYVIYDGSEYKMWYTGAPNTVDYRIGLATVPNLTIVPVELTSFTATTQLGKVILNWSTATEINNLGFEIERASSTTTTGQEKLWRTIGFVPGKGTTTEPQEYSYIDDISEINATSLVYRLKQMDFLGTYEYSDEVLVDNPAPVDYVLYQNYPNPFNPTTTITFGIPVKTHVVLKVFNAVGEEVSQLYNGEKEAGRHAFEFSAAGLPSGIYFYQLNAGDYNTIKKMILLK